MKPVRRPGSSVRNAGRPLLRWGSTSLATRRSGIVDRRTKFRFEGATDIVECVAVGTVDLRDASQGIGILYEVLRLAVRSDGRAASEKRAEITRNGKSPGVLAQADDLFPENRVGSEQRLNAHGTAHIGGAR